MKKLMTMIFAAMIAIAVGACLGPDHFTNPETRRSYQSREERRQSQGEGRKEGEEERQEKRGEQQEVIAGRCGCGILFAPFRLIDSPLR